MENTQQKLSPKFFFLSLGVLVSLITTVTAFINLVFETLNRKFPDIVNGVYSYGYSPYDTAGIRAALATLIIVAPVFFVLTHYWNKAIRTSLGRVDEIIRKWMIYLILFLSAVLLIVDLVVLVEYFVSGDLTTRFILKVAVLLIVGVYVGFYYIYQLLGRKKIIGMPIGIISVIKSSILIVLAIIWSFHVIGSPMTQRNLRIDQTRVNDLSSMQGQIISFWQQKEKLPDQIGEIANPLGYYTLPVDPEFEKGKAYEYKKTGDLSFELCAVFSLPMPKGWSEYGYGKGGGVMPMSYPTRDVAMSYPSYPGDGANQNWDHQEGRTCFARTIDPELYKPYDPIPVKE